MLRYLLAREQQAELARRAERARRIRDHERPRRAVSDADANADSAITLRLAGEADAEALADLAGLDSARVPVAPVLLAEARGEIRAALSLLDGAIIADPFHLTAPVCRLLRERAAQLRGDTGPAWRRWRARRGATATGLRRANPRAATALPAPTTTNRRTP